MTLQDMFNTTVSIPCIHIVTPNLTSRSDARLIVKEIITSIHDVSLHRQTSNLISRYRYNVYYLLDVFFWLWRSQRYST